MGIRLRALAERFQHIIRFRLAGHSHQESYQVINSMTNPEKPIMLATVGGIVTINGGYKHPSFMVVDLDAKTLLPVNMYTYYTNLDEANETGTPVWRVLHDYLKEYSLSDMSPASMRDLAIRILTNQELALKFENNLDRRTDHFVK